MRSAASAARCAPRCTAHAPSRSQRRHRAGGAAAVQPRRRGPRQHADVGWGSRCGSAWRATVIRATKRSPSSARTTPPASRSSRPRRAARSCSTGARRHGPATAPAAELPRPGSPSAVLSTPRRPPRRLRWGAASSGIHGCVFTPCSAMRARRRERHDEASAPPRRSTPTSLRSRLSRRRYASRPSANAARSRRTPRSSRARLGSPASHTSLSTTGWTASGEFGPRPRPELVRRRRCCRPPRAWRRRAAAELQGAAAGSA